MDTQDNKNKKEIPYQRMTDPGSVRIGPVGAIPALLEEYASTPVEKILAEAGLNLELFDDPENSINFVTVGRLLKLCARHTNIAHFGLLTGQNAGPESLGQFAQLASNAPNVGMALYSMILHICINDRGGVATLTSEKGTARLGYAIYIPMHEGISQVYNASLAIICNLMRAMCGETWNPAGVRFSMSKPANTRPYKSFFKAPLVFEADEDTIIFPDHWLKSEIPSADQQQYELLSKQFTILESSSEINFIEEIRSVLRPLIVSQACSPERVAQMLSLHPRTLNRRLEKQGTTLRDIIGELRYEVAKQFLAESSAPMIRISTLLGYADASVFTHAFRRWSGTTPTDWRNQNSIDATFADAGRVL